MSSDRPIVMSAPHIRGLLAGTKTQHRVPLKPQPGGAIDGCFYRPDGRWIWLICGGHLRESNAACGPGVGAGEPFVLAYTAGMKLWVRETYGLVAPDWCDDGRVYDGDNWEYGRPIRPDECTVEYRADLSPRCTDSPGRWPREEVGGPKWRSATQIPRWASRITLDVSDVRVQRLREIGEEDALAEGIDQDSDYYAAAERNVAGGAPWAVESLAFANLWNRLHAKPGERWDDDPWVCALSFAARLGNIDAQEPA